MTPKEIAIELVGKYSDDIAIATNNENISFAKQCALIAVDEVLDLAKTTDSITAAVDKVIQKKPGTRFSFVDLWEEVKKEIEKL